VVEPQSRIPLVFDELAVCGCEGEPAKLTRPLSNKGIMNGATHFPDQSSKAAGTTRTACVSRNKTPSAKLPAPCGIGRPAIGTVLQIHNGRLPATMKNLFMQAMLLASPNEQRLFPTAFLFNDVGLKIWSEIIESSDYTQTAEEIELLREYGASIAGKIKPGSSILDIGAG
jgi:hypothetical protein